MADRAVILERATELDDDAPDDVCPGCGRHITEAFRFHAHQVSAGDLCPWGPNELSARLARRLLLRGELRW